AETDVAVRTYGIQHIAAAPRVELHKVRIAVDEYASLHDVSIMRKDLRKALESGVFRRLDGEHCMHGFLEQIENTETRTSFIDGLAVRSAVARTHRGMSIRVAHDRASS